MHTHWLQNWIPWLVVGLLVVGLALTPGVGIAPAADLLEDGQVVIEPVLPFFAPPPGGGVGTNGFAWGG
jgi:hypothetical protein